MLYEIIEEAESEGAVSSSSHEEAVSQRQKNASIKARQFDFETMFKAAREGARERYCQKAQNAEGDGNESAKKSEEDQVHSRLRSTDAEGTTEVCCKS